MWLVRNVFSIGFAILTIIYYIAHCYRAARVLPSHNRTAFSRYEQALYVVLDVVGCYLALHTELLHRIRVVSKVIDIVCSYDAYIMVIACFYERVYLYLKLITKQTRLAIHEYYFNFISVDTLN